jgi:hypothetical protein
VSALAVAEAVASTLSRLLRLLSTAGLVNGERNEAGRSERAAPPTADGPTYPDHGYDQRAASILRRLNPQQRDRLLAAIGEIERLLAASSQTPPTDHLGKMLADIGCRIAQHGATAEPRIQLLADALRATRPVAAAVLASPTEPDIARARAYLHLARAAARLPQPQRDTLAAALAMT